MKLNNDLIIKNSLSGNETDYAPSVSAVKSKTDSIDNSINTINTTLNKRIEIMANKTFGSIAASGGSITYSYSDLTNGEIGLFLVTVIGTNPDWRNTSIVCNWAKNGFHTVTQLEHSNFELSIDSKKLKITNTNTGWSMDGGIMVSLIGNRYP